MNIAITIPLTSPSPPPRSSPSLSSHTLTPHTTAVLFLLPWDPESGPNPMFNISTFVNQSPLNSTFDSPNATLTTTTTTTTTWSSNIETSAISPSSADLEAIRQPGNAMVLFTDPEGDGSLERLTPEMHASYVANWLSESPLIRRDTRFIRLRMVLILIFYFKTSKKILIFFLKQKILNDHARLCI